MSQLMHIPSGIGGVGEVLSVVPIAACTHDIFFFFYPRFLMQVGPMNDQYIDRTQKGGHKEVRRSFSLGSSSLCGGVGGTVETLGPRGLAPGGEKVPGGWECQRCRRGRKRLLLYARGMRGAAGYSSPQRMKGLGPGLGRGSGLHLCFSRFPAYVLGTCPAGLLSPTVSFWPGSKLNRVVTY